MNNVIILIISVIMVYHLITLLYHIVFKVAYVDNDYRLIFCANLATIVVATSCLLWKSQYVADGNDLYILPVLVSFTVLDVLILRRNWQKYTLGLFVKNGIYDFEVQQVNKGLVWGRIYWNRKQNPNVYCSCWLKAEYEGSSFAKRRAEYIENSKIKIGDMFKVNFLGDVCFPYYSKNPTNGNVVQKIN